MSSDSIPYIIGLLTVAISIYTSRKSSNSTDRKADADERAQKSQEATEMKNQIKKLERAVAYLRKRDLWQQECVYRLIGAVESAGGTVPNLPEEPEPEPDLM